MRAGHASATARTDPRRGHRHPHARARADGRAQGRDPAHPPAPRPHPGPDVLPALLPLRRRDHDLGPASPEASLEDRVARYISAPLSPVEVRELPCSVAFRDAPATEWQIGDVPIRAEAVTHRGPTLGYRITDGDTTLCYIPDHEPALGAPLDAARERVDLGLRPRPRRRPPDPRLPVHGRRVPGARRLGPLGALRHAHLRRPRRRRRLLLFHHDPLHTDEFLDALGDAPRAPGANWATRRHDRASRGGRRVRGQRRGRTRLSKRVPACADRPVQTRPPKFRRADKGR